MGNSVQAFRDFYVASFIKEGQGDAEQLASAFFKRFYVSITQNCILLESYLKAGKISDFYNSIGELKYLVEYSDDLSRYWFLIRAYSGALAKIEADKTVKGAKKLYAYYFEKYGDRRTIKDEHWFEKKRWEFLDELQGIYNEYELELFVNKFLHILNENFRIYASLLNAFINDLKRIQTFEKTGKI